MKITDKKKPIKTVPKGVWESTRPDSSKNKSDSFTESVDLQENGYTKKQGR